MSRERDTGANGPHVDDADRLDPALQELFDRAYDEELPVDVGARHLWTLYRSARTPVAGVLSAPRVGAVRRRMVNATLAVVAFLLPGLLGQASAQALPGDLLYGVKRHHEQTQLETAISWETRDQLLAQQAEQRLIEAQAIARTRPDDVAHVIADADSAIEALGASPVEESRNRAEEIRYEATTQLAALVDDIAEPVDDAVRVAIEDLATPDAAGMEVRGREVAAAGGVTEDAVGDGGEAVRGSVPAGGEPSVATPGGSASAPVLVPSEDAGTPGSAATGEPEPMPSPREGPATESTLTPSTGPAGERPAAFPADGCDPTEATGTTSPSTPPHVLDLDRAACDDDGQPSTPPGTDTPAPTASPEPSTPAPTRTPSTPPVQSETPPATDAPDTPTTEPASEPAPPSEPSTPPSGSPSTPATEVPRSVQEPPAATPAAPQPDPTPSATPSTSATPSDQEDPVPSIPGPAADSDPVADPDPTAEPDSSTGPGSSSTPVSPLVPSPATTTTPLPSVSPALEGGPQAADMTPTTAPATP